MDGAQQNVLHGALAERSNGTWAAFEVGIIVPRQNLKTTLARVRQLSGLYLFGERLQTHTAHRADTCLEQFRYMKPLCEQMSDQMGDRKLKIKRIAETNGKESIELMSGQRLQFKARVKESGRGFDGEVVYLDEAMRLNNVGDLIPTMSAQVNPQLWYLSSAPLPKMESDILKRICRRGRRAARGETKEPRFAYFEWCAEEDPGEAPEDEDTEEFQEWFARWRIALAQANPALGRRIFEEFCHTERGGAMTHEEFARERLGIWPEDVSGETVIDPEHWKACSAPTSKLTGPMVLAFEVSADRKRTVIASAGPSTVTGTHVEVIENRAGTGWVIERLINLRDKHKPSAIVCNPSGGSAGLLPELERAKVEFMACKGPDYTQSCGDAIHAIENARWRHIDQASLTAAVTGAGKRITGDSWVFDRRGLLDISPLTAVVLGAWAVGKGAGPSVYEERGLLFL